MRIAPAGKPDGDIRKRNFPTFTRDLKQLRTWLRNCKVTEIATESTGQYWRAVWNLQNQLVEVAFEQRKGAPKAVMALAHHLITVVYNVLARGEEYVELGADYDDQRNKPKVVSRLVSRLLRLGYDVELKPVVPHEPPP